MSKTENELLKLVSEIFPKSDQQFNKINESDAEMIDLPQGAYAINIDEYNPDEDYFCELIPENLGYNLVMATCSDLIATGAKPCFFLHSMVLQEDHTFHYREKLLRGISEGLASYKSFLLGGDTSTANKWRYTAVAIGESISRIKRSGARSGQILYSTGHFGAGNRMALVQMLLKEGKLEATEDNILLSTPRFPNHLDILPLLAKYGVFAMDTSDGMVNTLHTLQENNTAIGFRINFNQELLDQQTQLLSTFAQLPKEVFLFATLGEYQIIFGIEEDQQIAFEYECAAANFKPIKLGQVVAEHGIHIDYQNRHIRLSEERPDPRGMSTDIYLHKIIEMVKRYFHE